MVTPLLATASERRILSLLVRRDLKLRYSQAVLGYLWTLLEPLAMAIVYWLVFTVILGARDLGEQPYILFLLMGLLSYNWFQSAISTGCRSLTAEAKMVRSASMPREIWVVRVVVSKMLDELVFAIPILVVIAAINHTTPNWRIVFFPVAMIIQFALTYGLCLILAPLTVLVDDVERVTRIVLRILFYLTPVIYGISDVSKRGEHAAHLAAFNPLSGIMCLYRMGFWPDQEAPPILYVSSVLFAVVSIVVGVWVFRRLEGPVLKEI